jgi:hypothetical protein
MVSYKGNCDYENSAACCNKSGDTIGGWNISAFEDRL